MLYLHTVNLFLMQFGWKYKGIVYAVEYKSLHPPIWEIDSKPVHNTKIVFFFINR